MPCATAHVRPRHIRPAVVAVGVLVVLGLAVGAGARIVSVHSQTWEWRLFPTAAPPRISFDDRDYIRSDAAVSPRSGFTVAGTTAGGGEIFASPPIPGSARTVIQVQVDGRTIDYSLSGGP